MWELILFRIHPQNTDLQELTFFFKKPFLISRRTSDPQQNAVVPTL
ncbi:hypothetical protein LEP1GSC019_2662 [Leptospira interrogans serovar Pyrogenes str. 2006006960]|nr:hypothetical protein LEP1GSC019_2662 [Leptospira interrogans serovar Pyrogenes str. 2006006960]EMN78845.1 hypothetical protein LEP1GSC106_2072 [Leptospira interrogans serovar Grippotyphosa str. UI 12764]